MPLCDESHRLFKCDRFLKLQPRQRANCAKQLGLCFNRLQPYFKGHTCSRQMCRKCNKRHHTLLHMDRENQMVYNKSSTSNKNLPADAKGISTAGGNTYGSYKGKPRNHILLATAIVDVKNKSGQYVPCRALLDSGSESSFITERCVQRLRLSRT